MSRPRDHVVQFSPGNALRRQRGASRAGFVQSRRRMVRVMGRFTLVELLVVLAIITLLAAFLMPSLGRARMLGRQIACIGNYKQLGATLHMYQSDYAGAFPSALANYGWAKYAKPYLGDPNPSDWYISSAVFLCTETDQLLPKLATQTVGINYHAIGSRYAGGSYPEGRHPWPKMQLIRQPARQLVLCDTYNKDYPDNSFCRAYAGTEGNGGTGMAIGRHGGMSNTLFADGHAVGISALALQLADDPFYSLPWNYWLK